MDGRDNAVIVYYIEQLRPEDEHVFDFIFSTFGAPSRRTENPDEAHISYLEKPQSSSSKLAIVRNEADILWKDVIENKLDASFIGSTLDFDLINAISYFLRDMGNKGKDESCYDEHQRLRYNSSFQNDQGIGALPVVNLYMLFLKELLSTKLDIDIQPFYPDGKKACVILSHDVDHPDKHASLKTFKLLPRNRSFKGFARHLLRLVGNIKGYVTDKHKDEFWCFEEVLEAEKQRGFKSTSFFAVVNKHDKRGDANLDVIYSVHQPRFKSVFERMKSEGFGIGVHSAYNAFQSEDQFSFEKSKLDAAAQCEVIGLRHHFWHMGTDPKATLLKHEEAGFKYDSSIAFNDHLGFRYSTAFPFYPFHSGLKRKIDVLQIPVFCMDGNLFYDDSMTVEKAIEEVSKQLDTLVDLEGIGSIDWHTRTSYPKGPTFHKWGSAYIEILDLLASRKEIWVTSAEEFYAWWMQRINEKQKE
ncbi:MAG: hypothetical protein ACI9RU_001887 [Litorivivens sp.]|jgi:hypothetical protein